MHAHARQKGITIVGFAVVLCIVGFIAYSAMKLIPIYTEYYGVVKSMKSLQTEVGVETMSIDLIRNKLDSIFSVQYVDEKDVPLKNINLITANNQHSLNIAYDVRVPFLYNIDLLVHFDKTVDLSHGATY